MEKKACHNWVSKRHEDIEPNDRWKKRRSCSPIFLKNVLDKWFINGLSFFLYPPVRLSTSNWNPESMDVLGLVLQPNFTGNEHHWRWEIHHDSYEWRTAMHFFTPQCCFWRQHVWVVSVEWHEASHQLSDCRQCRFSAGIWKTWRRLAQCRTEHDRFTVHAVEPTQITRKIVPVLDSFWTLPDARGFVVSNWF